MPWSCSPKAGPGCLLLGWSDPLTRQGSSRRSIVGGRDTTNKARRPMMPPDEPLRGVEKTALGVAMVRARESHQDDRLFDDPYAQAFVDAAPGAFPEQPKTPEELAALGPMASLGAVFYVHAVIRTRFFDDYLTAATAAGCSQVVLLAAGLDTRAFRLPWPQRTRVFEVDLPDVLAFKDSVLATQGAVPHCERTTVLADLRAIIRSSA